MYLTELLDLKSSGVILSDGGLASELEREHQDLNGNLWSGEVLLKNPSAIYDVHMKYLNAGSQIITTSGYQLSMNGLRDHGLSNDECIYIFQESVRIAKEAVCDYVKKNPSLLGTPLVAISMGCYGAFHYDRLMIYENYLTPELKKNTFYIFETIPNAMEAKCIKQAIQMVHNKSNEYIVSFSCCNESQLCDQTMLYDVVKVLNDEPQIICIGVNCTNPKYVQSLIQIIKETSTKSIIVYPNMGEEWDPIKHDYVPNTGVKTNEEFLDLSKKWIHNGIRILGGCCRTTPELIHLLSQFYYTNK